LLGDDDVGNNSYCFINNAISTYCVLLLPAIVLLPIFLRKGSDELEL
jgi:hypothetical protein